MQSERLGRKSGLGFKIRGKTRDGFIVYGEHLGDLREATIYQALSLVDAKGEKWVRATVDLRRPVGNDNVLSLEEGDSTFYARLTRSSKPSEQKKPGNWMRFVRRAFGVPTTMVTLRLSRKRSGLYHLTIAYAGMDTPRSPSDPYFESHPDERIVAEAFWAHHAVDAGAADRLGQIELGTERDTCPW